MVPKPQGIAREPRVDRGHQWRPSGRVIAIAASLAFLAKLELALRTFGTNDVWSWQYFAKWSRALGAGLYRFEPDFVQPPSIMHLLRAVTWLSNTVGVSFPFWMRVPAIVADPCSLWLVWKLLGPRVHERSTAWALLLLAVAPPLVLISGFHGNTDPVMVFFLLLSVYLAEKGKVWPAGAAFGLAMSVKVVPMMLIPVFFLYLANLRKQIQFFAAAGLVAVVCWSPFLFQDPSGVAKGVFGYRSLYGHWGLSWLMSRLAIAEPQFARLNETFRHYGTYLAFSALILLSLWMNRANWAKRAEPRPRLFSQVGIVFFLFMSISSGFAVQYLAWLVPWVVELGILPTAIFYAASGVFLFMVYDYWSQGSWYYANSFQMGDYLGHADYAQILCWLSVVFVLWTAWQRIGSGMVTFLPFHRSSARSANPVTTIFKS